MNSYHIMKLSITLSFCYILVFSVFSQPSNEHLVLHLTMDEGVIEDISSRTKELEMTGDFNDECGVIDGAKTFDGNSFIEVLSNMNEDIKNNFTLSFYFKPTARSGADQVLISKSDECIGATNFDIFYKPIENAISIAFRETFNNEITIEYQLPDNFCWYHVIFVRSNEEHILYINGEEVKRVEQQPRIISENSAFFTIGSGPCVPNRGDRFTGLMDDIRFYTAPYSIKDLAPLYSATQNIITQDTLIYLGDSVSIRVSEDCTDSYQWKASPEIENMHEGETIIRPQSEGIHTYQLSFIENNCSVLKNIVIRVVDPEDLSCNDVSLPNTFTPNGDGLNDIFFISNKNIIEEFESIQIFDRLGGLILSSEDRNATWDGSYKGERVPPGAYLYKIVHICNGEKKILQGTVNVLR